MTVKSKSLLGKTLIVVVSYALCVLKWCGLLDGASVTEIWGAGATAYGIMLGSVDFNIIHDSWVEVKKGETNVGSGESGSDER